MEVLELRRYIQPQVISCLNVSLRDKRAFQSFQIWLAAVICGSPQRFDMLLYNIEASFDSPPNNITTCFDLPFHYICSGVFIAPKYFCFPLFNTAARFDWPLYFIAESFYFPLYNRESRITSVLKSGEFFKSRKYLREFEAKIENI
jgi:hypothetical protein